MKVAETKEQAEAERKLVKELTGLILKLKNERGWTDAELAAAAKKKSASTFYGWRNGSRKNPSVLDLQAFAQAVGLDVRLLPHDAVDATGSVGLRTGVGRNPLKPETTEVVRMMESLSDEARETIRDAAFAALGKLNPPGAVESRASLDRKNQ